MLCKKVSFSKFEIIYEYILDDEEINMKKKHFRYICRRYKERNERRRLKNCRQQINQFGRFYIE